MQNIKKVNQKFFIFQHVWKYFVPISFWKSCRKCFTCFWHNLNTKVIRFLINWSFAFRVETLFPESKFLFWNLSFAGKLFFQFKFEQSFPKMKLRSRNLSFISGIEAALSEQRLCFQLAKTIQIQNSNLKLYFQNRSVISRIEVSFSESTPRFPLFKTIQIWSFVFRLKLVVTTKIGSFISRIDVLFPESDLRLWNWSRFFLNRNFFSENEASILEMKIRIWDLLTNWNNSFKSKLF